MRALIVIAALSLVSCASAPRPVPAPEKAPTYAEGYNEGIAAGEQKERRHVAAIVNQIAPAFDRAGCDVSTSWLPQHNRTIRQYAFARRREQELKIQCARKYRRAINSFISARRQIR